METQTPAAELPVASITFHGREMFVHPPSPEQLLVWRRALNRLETLDPESMTGVEVMNTLERLRKVVDSVLVSAKDIDWIDDEMLEGRLDLAALAPVITLTIDAFTKLAAESGNRATRRAATKAAKTTPARRKPAAPRTRKATS